MTAESPLRLESLGKRFGGVAALDGVTLDLASGSVTGLLGRNAAGKSTLIRCAVGLLRPTSGRAAVFGQEAWSLDADAKARLGYVPQDIHLYSWMRVGQLFEFTAAFYPRWNERLVADLLREWEVPTDRRIRGLSPGTLQKLAIVLALAHEPELLVLDEPAAALDPAARRQFLAALLDVASDARRTILFSTHITSDLERVADRVILLNEGRVTFHGGLDELKEGVKRLHVTSDTPLAADFDLPGRLRRRVAGREALVSVRGISPGLVEEVRRDFGASVRVEDLSLEDIFLEMQDA